MVKQNIGTSDSISPSFTRHPCSASQMGCSQRKNLSVHAIRRTESVTRLAQQHKVSRKFVYQQLAKAIAAIDQAFEPAEPKDEKVLFYLPITKTWIHQLVLSLILICHSSFRGVLDILDAMFDYHDMSLGTVHNNDILSMAGPNLQERQKLYDFVVEPDLRNGKTLSRLCDETGKLTGLNDIRSTSYLPGLGTASRCRLAIIYRFQKSCMKRLLPQIRLKLPQKLPQNSRALPQW